jgi:DinB superfamily
MRIELILENLARAQQRFLRTADAVSVERWQTRPDRDRWSAAELVAHLIVVESAVIGAAGRVLQRGPRRTTLLKKFHLPLALAEARVIKLKSPLPLDPELVREKETMLAELREVRRGTLAISRKRKGETCAPMVGGIGSLNMYGWFQLIASHQVRHEKQLRETADCLRKVIATLQK